MPFAPFVMVQRLDHVVQQVADDLAEGQRHDAEIVAADADDRQRDQKAHQTANRPADQQKQPERAAAEREEAACREEVEALIRAEQAIGICAEARRTRCSRG